MNTAVDDYRLFSSVTAPSRSARVLLLLVRRKVRQSLRTGCAAHLWLLDDKRFIFFKQSKCQRMTEPENGGGGSLADDRSGRLAHESPTLIRSSIFNHIVRHIGTGAMYQATDDGIVGIKLRDSLSRIYR